VRNIDRWFILIGLLYGIFGFAFGIWLGINERFELAPVHAHINLVGFASMVLFGLIYRAYPALAESKLTLAHFLIYTIGAVLFLAGLPLRRRIRPSPSPSLAR
jgi:cbb3-type cytochrome oxidase subunit 1